MQQPISLVAILLLAQASAYADGGSVQLRAETGGFVITLFTSPAPLTNGPVDVSLLLQNRAGLEPVLDADVSLILRAPSGREIRTSATREVAQNKLLYAAPVTLTEQGPWRVAINILRNGESAEATGTIDVASPAEMRVSYWSDLAFPPVVIAFYVVRERLIRRKRKG